MVESGGGSMGITLPNVPPFREYEENTSGTTRVYGVYTKNDARVAKLRIRIKNNGNVVGETYIDVSGINVGQNAGINVQLTNGLAQVTVNADSMQSDTVPADGSKTYTAPSDHLLVIKDIDGALNVDGWPTNWPANVVVYPGASVTIINQDAADHLVELYTIPVSELSAPAQLELEIAELDAGNTEIYVYSATIDDVPPLQIEMAGQEGQVQVQAIA